MVLRRLQGERGRARAVVERSDDGSHSTRRSSSKERTPTFIQRRSSLMGMTLLASVLLLGSMRVSRKADVGQTEAHHNLRSTALSDSQCQVYLAESSIPNGGLGVFTTKNVPLGGQIGHLGACILVDIPRSGADQLYTHTHVRLAVRVCPTALLFVPFS